MALLEANVVVVVDVFDFVVVVVYIVVVVVNVVVVALPVVIDFIIFSLQSYFHVQPNYSVKVVL